MIRERFMVTAKTVTQGTHTGYITTSPDGTLMLEWREYGLNPDNPRVPQTVKAYVDTDTIEPEAVQVDVGENRNVYCPNCTNKIGAFCGRNYCPDCGQRLDWEVEGDG